jgi:uncharacterized membrane protein YeaQ/YmgE (transglycosylase-associated protein family)
MEPVVGIFVSRSAAELAARNLRAQGWPPSRVRMLPPERSAEIEAMPVEDAEQPGVGRALGGVLAAAVGATAGMGLGAVAGSSATGLAAAIILGILGAVVGVAVSGALEKRSQRGLPHDEVYVYEDALEHPLRRLCAGKVPKGIACRPPRARRRGRRKPGCRPGRMVDRPARRGEGALRGLWRGLGVRRGRLQAGIRSRPSSGAARPDLRRRAPLPRGLVRCGGPQDRVPPRLRARPGAPPEEPPGQNSREIVAPPPGPNHLVSWRAPARPRIPGVTKISGLRSFPGRPRRRWRRG